MLGRVIVLGVPHVKTDRSLLRDRFPHWWFPLFAFYFVGMHASAHVAALVRHPGRAPCGRNAAAPWRLAFPATLLTMPIWLARSGPGAERLLSVPLQLLATLTLPHMVLDVWLQRRDAVEGAGALALHAASPIGERIKFGNCPSP